MIESTEYQCILCGKTFQAGNDEDGIPNGIGFHLQSGATYNLCKDCISGRYQEAIKLIEEKEGI